MQRGLFIVFEGIDKSGKSTQCLRLKKYLEVKGFDALIMRFPCDRNRIGSFIIDTLKKKIPLPEGKASSLLFAADRWEASEKIERILDSGVSIICDRYALSGVAYSLANGVDVGWSAVLESGLPLPSVTLFLDADPAEIRARYNPEDPFETPEFQERVHESFKRLVVIHKCPVIGNGTEDEVFEKVKNIIDRLLPT